MIKIITHSMLRRVIVFLIVFNVSSTFAFEAEGVIPQVEVILPGMTRTIEVTQNYSFPQDYNKLFLYVIGYGGLSVTARKIDTEGDLLMVAGLGISSLGIVPLFKFGTTGVTLTEAVEIGDQFSPYGIVWIVSWVDSPIHTPPHHYSLVLSF